MASLRYNGLTVYSIPASESYQVMVSDSFFSTNHNAQLSGANASSTQGTTTSTNSLASVATSTASITVKTTSTATSNTVATSTIAVVIVPSGEIEFEVGNPSFQPLDDAPPNCNVWASVPDGMGCDDFAAGIAETEPSFTIADLVMLNPSLNAGDGTCDSGT